MSHVRVGGSHAPQLDPVTLGIELEYSDIVTREATRYVQELHGENLEHWKDRSGQYSKPRHQFFAELQAVLSGAHPGRWESDWSILRQLVGRNSVNRRSHGRDPGRYHAARMARGLGLRRKSAARSRRST